MIPRYARPEMTEIWSDQSKYEIWLQVETLALERMVAEGLAPEDALQAVREKGTFSAERVLEIESEVKHDVIAFLTNVAEGVGPLSRYVHRGMTSNDLLDTTFAVQLRRSGLLILEALSKLTEVVMRRAEEFRHTPCIGRSHGIHAEPTSFGLKALTWYAELQRGRSRLLDAIEEISTGKIAGAVGTYASVSPEVELHVLTALNLKPESVATQVVARDRHANFFCALAQLAGSIERICVEIRHLQRTEVREVSEPFGSGQKGSSAMPHKKNPILTENLTGLARIVRSNSIAALENVALWHERDISHSSVERIIAPDSCILVHFMIERLRGVINGLVVYPERMLENINYSKGLIYSGTLLIALVDKGVTREDAYRLVQTHALAAWEKGESLQERLEVDDEITAIFTGEELAAIFDIGPHLERVDYIFERVLQEYRESAEGAAGS